MLPFCFFLMLLLLLSFVLSCCPSVLLLVVPLSPPSAERSGSERYMPLYIAHCIPSGGRVACVTVFYYPPPGQPHTLFGGFLSRNPLLSVKWLTSSKNSMHAPSVQKSAPLSEVTNLTKELSACTNDAKTCYNRQHKFPETERVNFFLAVSGSKTPLLCPIWLLAVCLDFKWFTWSGSPFSLDPACSTDTLLREKPACCR